MLLGVKFAERLRRARIARPRTEWGKNSEIRLAVDFDQAPVGDQHFGARGHGAEFTSDLDFFRLGGLGKPLLESSDLLTALLTGFEFRFSFAKSQEKVSTCKCPLVPQLPPPFLAGAARLVNPAQNGQVPSKPCRQRTAPSELTPLFQPRRVKPAVVAREEAAVLQFGSGGRVVEGTGLENRRT